MGGIIDKGAGQKEKNNEYLTVILFENTLEMTEAGVSLKYTKKLKGVQTGKKYCIFVGKDLKKMKLVYVIEFQLF